MMCCVIEWMDSVNLLCHFFDGNDNQFNSRPTRRQQSTTITTTTKQRQIFELHAKSNLLKMFTGNFTLGTKILVDVNDGSCNDTE